MRRANTENNDMYDSGMWVCADKDRRFEDSVNQTSFVRSCLKAHFELLEIKFYAPVIKHQAVNLSKLKKKVIEQKLGHLM